MKCALWSRSRFFSSGPSAAFRNTSRGPAVAVQVASRLDRRLRAFASLINCTATGFLLGVREKLCILQKAGGVLGHSGTMGTHEN